MWQEHRLERPEPVPHVPDRKDLVRGVVIVQGQAVLLQFVAAFGAPRRFAGLLDGGEQQGDEDGNDGNDDEQLNQRECDTWKIAAHRDSYWRCVRPGSDELPSRAPCSTRPIHLTAFPISSTVPKACLTASSDPAERT